MTRLPSLALLMLASVSASAVEIIAHRGASEDAPENTLSSMKLAWEQGTDAVELDLWLSKDGKLIVFHDSNTKRLAGVDRKISDYTAEEAAQLDVGKWKAPQYSGEKIPSLESILATIPEGRRAVLEIKCGPEIVPELARVLRTSKVPIAKLAVISFQAPAVAASKKELPEIPHFLLKGYAKKGEPVPDLVSVIAKAKEIGCDGLNLHKDWPIDRTFVTTVKAEGLKLLTWTVNDATVAKRLAEAGVDGITTDRPGWLRQELKK